LRTARRALPERSRGVRSPDTGPNHPDGNYEIANRVRVFEPPNAISWEPGYDADDGSLRFGGWIWRYDLTPTRPSGTKVTWYPDEHEGRA
jgi:hypothetical protein